MFVYMKYTLEQKNISVDISQIIESGRNAELSRDIEGFIDVFRDIWSDLDSDPEFYQFDVPAQAELFRLTGFFLSYFGKAKNLPAYQERGKNLLTKSIIQFTQLDERYKVAEAKVMLSACYFAEGAIEEFELILEETKREFEGNHLHPVYLQICINRLVASISKKQYQESFEILNEISVPMEFCEDLRLRTLFHEKSGMVYRHVGQYEKAIEHYNKAFYFAEKSKNNLFLALNKNNIAILYRVVQNFELAFKNVNESIALAYKHNFTGWLPHFLDSKATIYSAEGQHETALDTVDNAISIFRKGEDANGLTESMWNKCKFLFYLDRKEEAILYFSELLPIARKQMGEFAVQTFTKEFSEMIHIKKTGSLEDNLKDFKYAEIAAAIKKTNYNLAETAKLLEIEYLELKGIIDKEFPQLSAELNLQTTGIKREKIDSQKDKISSPRKISSLKLKDVAYSFAGEAPENFSTFYISSDKLPGSNEDIIAAIITNSTVSVADWVLLKEQNKEIYYFGKVCQDKLLNLSYILDESEDLTLFLNDYEIIGKAAAFCPFNEIDKDRLNFKEF